MKHSVDDILLQFNNKIRLSDFLSKYISLKQKGNEFVACCPFHNEKTPSFSVNDSKSLFYCFGCGAGGNVINFIEKQKNYSFVEALNYICDYLGIKKNDKHLDESFKKRNFYLRMSEIVNEIYFENLLKSPNAQKYLFGRGINLELIKKFKLGLCLKDNRVLEKNLNSKGFTNQDLIDFGLIIKSSKTDNYFHRFQNRITFPISDFRNNIVGFGGRTLINSKIKYINSPENEIFKKNNNLYGFVQNFDDIKKTNSVIITEGYIDVISLNSKGLNYSVATLGTALSETQLNKLWQYVDTPIICFDGDEAGKSAMQKISVKVLKYLKPGKSLKFMSLPNSYDPDTFIQNNSLEEFTNYKNSAINLSDFVWNNILDNQQNTTPEYSALIDEKIKNITKEINNKLISNEYSKYLREKKSNHFWNKRKIQNNKIYVNRSSYLKNKKNMEANEILLLSFLVFETEICLEFIEEIVDLKFNSENLETFRQTLIESLTLDYESNKNSKNFLLKNEVFMCELKELRKNHYQELTSEKKKLLFRDIITNLKLPRLLEEREKIRNKIINAKKNSETERFIKSYEKLTNEIKLIKSKEI